MSPRLPRVTATDLVRALNHVGWIQVRQHGSHVILEHPSKPGLVVVPPPKGKVLRPGTVAKTLKDASLTPEDIGRLLR